MIIGGIAGRTSFIEVNTLFLISLDLGNMGVVKIMQMYVIAAILAQ